MRLTKFVLALSLLFSAAFTFADDDSSQGSFNGVVTDGSEMVKYNEFLDRLKDAGLWMILYNYANSSKSISFAGYSSWRDVFVNIVEENGGPKVPPYAVDTLNLGGLSGYRAYAEKALNNSAFVASPESCGAAITYVVPSAVATLLFDKRPAFIEGPTLTKDEQVALANQYGLNLQKDFKSLMALCAGQDKRVLSGYYTFLSNLTSDVDRVLPEADAVFAAHAPVTPAAAYTATISCGMNGQNYNVLACFKDSELKITTAEGGKLYKVYNLEQAGVSDRAGLHISLPERFELNAQNSQRTLVLTISIKNTAGKEVYSDQQGQWGVISVKN